MSTITIARSLSCAVRSAARSAHRSPFACAGPAALRSLSQAAAAGQQRGQQYGHASAARLGAALVAFAAGGVVAAQAEPDPSRERSFIAIKPDGVHRGLIAKILARFEEKGYKLVAIKLIVPSKELAGQHYAEHEGKPFFPKLVNFLSSGPVLAMVWEGKQVISYGRTLIGATNPLASPPGSIRGDYGIDVGRNIVHGSDSVASAQREIALWFRPEELANWTPVASPWLYE